MHTPASKRKNRQPRGEATITKWGFGSNKNKTPKRYGKIKETYQRMIGTSVFAT